MPRAVPTHRPRPAQKRDHRAYDRLRRDREAKAFYHTAAWQKLRVIKLVQTPYCEECMRSNVLTQATIAHHKRELRECWEERLNLENLQSLCSPCHSRHHAHQADHENA